MHSRRRCPLPGTVTSRFAVLLAVLPALAADPDVRELLGQQRFAEALAAAASLNRRQPDNVEAYRWMAEAHMALGQYREAESDAQWMLDLREGHAEPEGMLCVARLRDAFGDSDGAIEMIQGALRKIDPWSAQLRATLVLYLARLHLRAGKPEIAAGWLEQFPQAAGGGTDVRIALAEVRIAQARPTEAIQLLQQSCPALRCLYTLAQALEHAGLAPEARAAYSDFARRARQVMDQPETDNRELILFDCGPGRNPAEALRLAMREVSRRRDIATLDLYAWALYANQRLAEAREEIGHALSVGTRDPGILEHARVIQGR